MKIQLLGEHGVRPCDLADWEFDCKYTSCSVDWSQKTEEYVVEFIYDFSCESWTKWQGI
jgi:hypothetical protein